MTRNTTRRVEVAAPILSEEVKKRVLDIFDTQMQDNVKARIMQPDGNMSVQSVEISPLTHKADFTLKHTPMHQSLLLLMIQRLSSLKRRKRAF